VCLVHAEEGQAHGTERDGRWGEVPLFKEQDGQVNQEADAAEDSWELIHHFDGASEDLNEVIGRGHVNLELENRQDSLLHYMHLLLVAGTAGQIDEVIIRGRINFLVFRCDCERCNA